MGTLVMGASLAGVSITPLYPVAAASRTTIYPAPFAPAVALAPVVTVVRRPKHQSPLAGLASWYGAVLHGHRSADGGIFDESEMTAAHQTLPFGTRVRVVDVVTGRSVIVRITDRGVLAPGRVIDLSSAAADSLGILSEGVARVRLEVLAEAKVVEEDAVE